jgi:hypothetical protein
MTVFIVKNTSVQKKTITVFGLSLAYGNSADLMLLANVTENVIADSLLKGELKTKINSGDLVVIQSTVLVPSADSVFTAFLVSCGIGDSVHPEQSHGFLTQATWYIDPVNGRDNKDGKTAAKALKTFAELNRRLGPPGTVLSPNNPTYAPWDPSVFTGNIGNIYLLGDLPDSDQINFYYTMATDCRFIITGTKKPMFIGTRTVDSVQAKNSSINQPWTITDAATDFRPLKGKMVEIMSGPGAGSRAYVARAYTDKLTVATPGSIGEEYFIAAMRNEIRVVAASLSAHAVALLLSTELAGAGIPNTVSGAVITLTTPEVLVFNLSDNVSTHASKAHMSEWCTGETPDFFGYGSMNLPSDPPATGSTFRVLDLSAVVPGIVESNGNELNSIGSLTFRYLKLKSLTDPSVGPYSWMQFKTNNFSNMLFGDCMFETQDAGIDWFPDGSIEVTNCCSNMELTHEIWSGIVAFHTCLFLGKASQDYPNGGIAPHTGAMVDINGCSTFVGLTGPWDYSAPDINGAGRMSLGDVSIWDNAAHGLVSNGAYVTLGDRGHGDSWHNDPRPRIWGDGNPGTFFFFQGTDFHAELFDNCDIDTPVPLPTLVNGLYNPDTAAWTGDEGTPFERKSFPFDNNTASFLPAVDNTWANLAIAMPVGFQEPVSVDFGPWGAFANIDAKACYPSRKNNVSYRWGRYERPPEIDSLTPATGTHLGGTPVSITALPSIPGEGHQEYKVGVTVMFDGVPATSIVRVNGQLITCVSPVHAAGIVTVTVTNPSGAFAESEFTYT